MLKTNKNDFIKLLIVGAALGASASVFAYEKGDIQLRFGLATVSPDDDSSEVSIAGVPQQARVLKYRVILPLI